MKHFINPWKLQTIATIILLFSGTLKANADPYLLVNSQGSDAIVKFDITTGAAELFGVYKPGDKPRNLAINDQGEVFASLNDGNDNVVKLVPQANTDILKSQNFSPTIGNFGPGQIHFYKGDLYAAGDASRVIFQYDGITGAKIRSFTVTGANNIRAMTIAGDYLYYTEIFHDRVRRFDLSQTPPTGGAFFTDKTNLDDSWNMTEGYEGRLIIANRGDPLIQQFDINTGAFLGTLADVSDFASTLTRSWDVTYDNHLENYFVSAGSAVFRLDNQGSLLQTYQSPLLQEATGVITVFEPVPEPRTLLLILICAFCLVLKLKS